MLKALEFWLYRRRKNLVSLAGFTLLEILLIIVAVGILIGIVIVAFQRAA